MASISLLNSDAKKINRRPRPKIITDDQFKEFNSMEEEEKKGDFANDKN